MDQLQWKVIQIRRETDQASTIHLETTTGQAVSYQAGQFLTLLFRSHGDLLRRSYSFSSTPGIDKAISITVKRIPNGTISRRLVDHCKPGDSLLSLMPAGRFTADTNPLLKRQFFFFAAGSGISPVFSLLKKILHEEPFSGIVLVYQNRHEKDIIFKNELEDILQKNRDRFTLINLLSKPREPHTTPHKLTNFIVEQIILSHRLSDRDVLFYLCGPVSFMRMIQFTVRWMGFDEEQIKKEFFTVEHVPGPPLMQDRTEKNILIHHGGKEIRFKAAYPVSILQSALNHRIQLPFSCRAGRCPTCIARCISGRVIMSNNEVLTDEDLKNGLVLTCVGYAETDLELEI